MKSEFAVTRPRAPIAPAIVDEEYALAGLNLRDPDAIMPPGESPWTINSRMFARNDGDQRVASRTRMGASHLSTPVGQTANVSNTATTTGDLAFSPTRLIAQPFTPSSTGALTRIDLNIKNSASATGHVIVEIYANASGIPDVTMLAQGSILGNNIATTYGFVTAYFIDAPTLTSGTQYWIVVYVQDNGTGSYYLNQTAGSGAMDYTSSSTVRAWSALNCWVQYKTYLSTAGRVSGFTLRYPSNLVNKILFSQLGNLYYTDKVSGTPTLLDSTMSSAATYMRFEQANDYSIYVNGINPAKWWDGTNTPVAVPNVPSAAPSNVIAWQNRLFFVTGPTRVDFSDLANYTSYPSVNFFYVPTPLNADHISGWKIFQNHLVIFTHNSKHIISGSDIANFTRTEAVGTKGAVSQEAIVADHNFIYFMAPDKQIYRFNGKTEQLISDKVQPQLQGITDVTKVKLSVYRNQLRVYFPYNPSGTANQCLVLDMTMPDKERIGQWFLDTDHQVAGSTALTGDGDSNELIEFSSVVGRVYYGETQYSDLGRMLDYKYWTNYKTYMYRMRSGKTLGGASSKKRVKRFHPVVRTEEANYTLSVGKDMDFNNTPDMRAWVVSGGGATWGNFVWGDGTLWGQSNQVQTLSGMSGRGWHLQYRFERKGVETPVELYGFIAQFKVGRQK